MTKTYNYLINFVVIAIIMALIDSVYLTSMSPFFNTLIQQIQGTPIKLDLLATFIVYLCLVFQLYYFILKNIETYTSLYQLVLDSFIMGFTTYGVYEFTNKAIIKKWTYEATLYDTLWGGILYSLTSIGFFYYNKFLNN